MGSANPFADAVRKIWEQYCSTMLSGDMDRWITLWDEDGVQMPPDTPTRSGRDLILREMKKGYQTARYTAFAIEFGEAVADANYGFARGTYTYAFTRPGSGEKHAVAGKYLTIFRRHADGSWKICRDCFNRDAPLA